MIEKRYDVYLDKEKISSDKHVEDAMIFIKAFCEGLCISAGRVWN